MSATTILVRDNGPYVIRGRVAITDARGQAYEAVDDVALCRCGASANKPFCDKSHRPAGFERVVRASEPPPQPLPR